ncbi:MAG: dipeptide epimerase [Tenacibaculum sp.]|nr:dipeptide epimerase [Tenacibaculum sp.]
MELKIHTYNLELKHPFTISRGTRTHIPSLIVELQDSGFSGFGEATANPYYNTTVEGFTEYLEEKRSVIESYNNGIPENFWEFLYPSFKSNPFLLCALDEAYYDLYCKKNGIKVYEYLNALNKAVPLSNYTIGIDTIETMVSKMIEMPFPVYKIKLGTKDDIKIVEELRKHTNSVFRIDANCGWNAGETIHNSIALKKLGVEFIEQPLPADDWQGAKKVFKKSVLPIIADESCIEENDVQKCHNHFHGVNIKLMKCGGITPTKRMINEAKKLGLKTMVGCMTESSVGISAITQLAPFLNYIDADGALLLKNDIASGVTIKNGTIIFSKNNGTGVSLK